MKTDALLGGMLIVWLRFGGIRNTGMGMYNGLITGAIAMATPVW